jgi:hypothetical protein
MWMEGRVPARKAGHLLNEPRPPRRQDPGRLQQKIRAYFLSAGASFGANCACRNSTGRQRHLMPMSQIRSLHERIISGVFGPRSHAPTSVGPNPL